MKKLFIMLAAVAAISFTACTGGDETTSTASESTEITVDNFESQLDSLIAASDTAAVQELVTKSQEKVDALIAAGDTVAAQTLVEKIQAVINANKEKLVALTPSLGKLVENSVDLPEAVKTALGAGVDSVAKAAAEEGKAKLEEAAGATVEDMKNKVQDGAKKVEEVKGKVEEGKKVVNDVKDASNKAKEAAQALKNLGK